MKNSNLPAVLPALLNEEQCAEFLGVSVPFLRKDRLTKKSIPTTTLGSRIVRYPVAALQRLIESNTVIGGAA